MSEKKTILTDAAREMRNEYARKWRKQNPEKVRESSARYWQKKAAEMKALEGDSNGTATQH